MKSSAAVPTSPRRRLRPKVTKGHMTKTDLKLKGLDTKVPILDHRHPTWNPQIWDLNTQNCVRKGPAQLHDSCSALLRNEI